MTDADITLFENYLNGLLEKEEIEAFESRLDSDNDFFEAFNSFRDAQKFLRLVDANEVEEKVRSVYSMREPEHNPSKKSVNKIPIIGGLAIMSLLALYIFLKLSEGSNQNDPENLFASHFEVYPDFITTMGGDSTETRSLAECMNLYNSKAYASATDCYLQLNDSPHGQFYLSMCYLEQGQADKAIPILESMKDNSLYQEAAIWYLALAHLSENNEEIAAGLLRAIASKEGVAYKKSEAQAILGSLGSNK